MKNPGNMLLVGNWESDVGYAWWLMENFWVSIAEELTTENIKSFLIYPKVTTLPANIDASDITIIEHAFDGRSISALKRLRQIIKNNNIKYIYLTDHPSYSWIYPLVRMWGVKKIFIHDHTPGERTTATGIKRIAKTMIQKIPFLTADHYIAVTDFVYNRFINVACIPAYKCHCASNGIYPIDLQDADTLYVHKLLNIPQNKIIVITTGRATFYKGIDFFIECANEIVNNRQKSNFVFVFCGDGPDIEIFKGLVEKYRLTENFIFAGRRNDIRSILPSCDIGFHSATGEVGYSLSILEYMSAGIATIVPDNPSTSLSINHNINGFLYQPKNISSAVNTLLIAADKSIKPGVTKNAIDDVYNKFNIDNTNKQLQQIISSNLN